MKRPGFKEERSLSRSKLVFVIVLVLAALFVGNYLSGALTLLLLGLDADLLKVGTYWQYIKALDLPQVAPYVSKIELAGYVGFGVPAAAFLVPAVWLLKPAKKGIHGDARFATTGDLTKHGLLKASKDGVVVGKFNGKLVRLGGQQFVILAAPTRSGKGV